MRLQKIMLFIPFFLILANIPNAAYSLTVTITSGEETVTRSSTATITDPPGVFTTTVDISNIVMTNGVEIMTTPGAASPASAVVQQSGSIDRLTVVNTTITAPATGGCPCTITISAASDSTDFTAKPAGSYPSGIILSGFFASSDPTLSPSGDMISVTADANGDAINATPGAGVDDTGVSLPSACAGDPGARFIANIADPCTGDIPTDSFYDQMAETLQLECGNPDCIPSLRASATITLNSGNFIDLPLGAGQTRTPKPGQTSAAPLLGALLSSSAVTAKLDVIRPSSFQLKALVTLSEGNDGINPVNEYVAFRVGPFSTTIPAGSFRKIPHNRFAFEGVSDGATLQIQIPLLGSGSSFEFKVDGQGAGLTGIMSPVPVEITIGNDHVKTLVKANIK